MRNSTIGSVNGTRYDVAVLGAGISGARIFHRLCREGYRVLLLDRGDFSAGTSQASGMMIWGGLLYLKDFDIRTVRTLCRARDSLIADRPTSVVAQDLRYLPSRVASRSRHLVRAGMWAYWLLGSRERAFPGGRATFGEEPLLLPGRFQPPLAVEEAVLAHSDCRFVLDWILPFLGTGSAALNHCEAVATDFDRSAGRWRLGLHDRIGGREMEATARYVVNATGVWTDTVNGQLGLESPYRHELSKGVYLVLPRPDPLREILVVDRGTADDVLTFSPWGPVALWGSTEERVTDIREGYHPTTEDVRSLLALANENLATRYDAGDVVALRCGIRPLAVRRGFSQAVHPLTLSRRHLIHHDRDRHAVAVYGGKLTSSGTMADAVCTRLAPDLPRRSPAAPQPVRPPETESFPGLDAPVPAARWCRDHELCCHLDDYLRRRTNISQWVARAGLGCRAENRDTLHQIARIFSPDERAADAILASYEQGVAAHHDAVLASV